METESESNTYDIRISLGEERGSLVSLSILTINHNIADNM